MPLQTLHLLHLKQQCLLCGKEVKIALGHEKLQITFGGRQKKGIQQSERIHTVHLAVRLLPTACKAELVIDGHDATGPVWQPVPERAPKVSDSTYTKS